MKKSLKNFKEAKAYAFRLLKIRARSEKEIYSCLLKRKFSQYVILKTIYYLKELAFINDYSFAESWIDSKTKKGYGSRRINFELRRKGIDKKIIEQLFIKKKNDLKITQKVRELANQRYKRLLNQTQDPLKSKRRLYGFLLRRGYLPEEVQDIITSL